MKNCCLLADNEPGRRDLRSITLMSSFQISRGACYSANVEEWICDGKISSALL